MREQRSHPLTRIREQQNLTQDRLAEVTRISARTIMRAEQNRLIAAESRRRLCEYFGLTAEELGLHLPGSQATPETAMKEEFVPETAAQQETQNIHNHPNVVVERYHSEGLHPISHPQHTFIDWGEAPFFEQCYGREKELTTLRSWMIEDQYRVAALFGMGGIGKTSLAVALVDTVKDSFEYVFWRSLQHAPLAQHVLRGCIQFISNQQQTDIPDDIDTQLALLLHFLQAHHCLLVFDNCETVLQSGIGTGRYRDGYEDYGKLFRWLGETRHQSSVVLTSREKIREIAVLEGENARVRSYHLSGLQTEDGINIVQGKGLTGSVQSVEKLIDSYAGNPLALKLVSQFIHEVFQGEITAFLQDGQVIFSDIQDVLDQQVKRLSSLEQEIMYWLVIEREAISLEKMSENLVHSPTRKAIQAAVQSLRRRYLLEASTSGFTLQNVIMEYMTERLVTGICEELRIGQLTLLGSHALMLAQAKEYLRESQIHLILQPIGRYLLTTFGKEESESILKNLLSTLHERPIKQSSYAAGNILNMLVQLGYTLRGWDFSHLEIRQAYLQGANLSEANFTSADFSTTVFTDIFGSILSVTFHPQGTLLAAGTTNNDIRLWQANGLPYLALQGHTAWVRSIAFSPDGRFLASGSDDQTVRLWDISTGQCLTTLRGHSAWIRSVAFSPDGSLLVSSGEDQIICVWDRENGYALKTLQKYGGRIRSVAFSPDGSLLASAGEERIIRLWDIQRDSCFSILQGHTNRIRSVAFSPDGTLLASSGDDLTIRLWDVRSGECVHIFQGHTDCVRSITFHPRGGILASGGEDQTVRLWDVKNGNCLRVLQGHTNWIWSVAFNSDGNVLVSGSEDQTMRLWQAESGHCLKLLQGYINWAWSIAFSPSGTILAGGNEDHTIHLWSTKSDGDIGTLHGHSGRVRSVAFSPNGHLLASSSEDRTVCLWDTVSGQCVQILQDRGYRIWSVAFSPDSHLLVGGGEDQAVYLWNVSSSQCLNTFQGHTDRIRAVAFHPEGNIIASCSEDQTIRLWDTHTGSCISTLCGHTGRVWSVDFHPCGDRLVSGGDDNTVRIWSVENASCLSRLEGHSARVRSVAFSPDGSMVGSGSEDGCIYLWKVDTGQCMRILQGHTGRMSSVVFHPHDPILISSNDDGTVRFWDIHTGQGLKTLKTAKPYERMKITGAKGINEVQKNSLKNLGAFEE